MLNDDGAAVAAIHVPDRMPPGSVTLHHAFLVYTASGVHWVSNAVPLSLK
ncbi:MAG: hypothetical protein H6837_07235 [Planctomycetes bacterium]|nr:hypothetical protein [Planctomycetota bacterium]